MRPFVRHVGQTDDLQLLLCQAERADDHREHDWDVQKPGRYENSRSIDLANLIALAGGATPDGDMGEVKITRLLEAEGRITKGEYVVDLDDIVRTRAADLTLAPGDVV